MSQKFSFTDLEVLANRPVEIQITSVISKSGDQSFTEIRLTNADGQYIAVWLTPEEIRMLIPVLLSSVDILEGNQHH